MVWSSKLQSQFQRSTAMSDHSSMIQSRVCCYRAARVFSLDMFRQMERHGLCPTNAQVAMDRSSPMEWMMCRQEHLIFQSGLAKHFSHLIRLQALAPKVASPIRCSPVGNRELQSIPMSSFSHSLQTIKQLRLDMSEHSLRRSRIFILAIQICDLVWPHCDFGRMALTLGMRRTHQLNSQNFATSGKPNPRHHHMNLRHYFLVVDLAEESRG